MTVAELVAFLQQQDQSKVVQVWNGEWDAKDPLQSIEVDADGDILIFG